MTLSNRPTELLSELNRLETLRENDARADCKRQFKRHIVRGEAELHAMDRTRISSVPITVKLRDISRGGMGFVCHQPLGDDTSWRVCFLQHGHVIGEQAMLIRHCRVVGNGVYLHGGQFIISDGAMITLGIDNDDLIQRPHHENELNNDLGDFLGPDDLS